MITAEMNKRFERNLPGIGPSYCSLLKGTIDMIARSYRYEYVIESRLKTETSMSAGLALM